MLILDLRTELSSAVSMQHTNFKLCFLHVQSVHLQYLSYAHLIGSKSKCFRIHPLIRRTSKKVFFEISIANERQTWMPQKSKTLIKNSGITQGELYSSGPYNFDKVPIKFDFYVTTCFFWNTILQVFLYCILDDAGVINWYLQVYLKVNQENWRLWT